MQVSENPAETSSLLDERMKRADSPSLCPLPPSLISYYEVTIWLPYLQESHPLSGEKGSV